jgi:hypothetical protein
MPDFQNWNNEPAIDVEQGASSGRSRHVAPEPDRLPSKSAGLAERRRRENRIHLLAIGLILLGAAGFLFVLIWR